MIARVVVLLDNTAFLRRFERAAESMLQQQTLRDLPGGARLQHHHLRRRARMLRRRARMLRR